MEMGFFAVVKKRLRACAAATISLTLGMIFFIPGLFLQISNLLIILAVGAIAVGLRDLFLAMIPWLVQNIGFTLDIVNPFLFLLSMIINDITVVVELVENVVEALSFGALKVQGFSKLSTLQVNATQVTNFLTTVKKDCSSIDNAGIIISSYTLESFSSQVCPSLRFAAGVGEWSFPLLNVAVGWISEPYYPNKPEGSGAYNCQCDTRMSVCPLSDTALCSFLGAGYVVLEVIFPLALIALGYTYWGPSLLKLAWNVFMLGVDCIIYCLRVTLKVVKLVEKISAMITKRFQVKI